MTLLQTRYSAEIERAVSEAGRLRERVTVEATDGAEAYAYPLQSGVAWGVNAPGTGVNILRGVRRSDGTDESEGGGNRLGQIIADGLDFMDRHDAAFKISPAGELHSIASLTTLTRLPSQK